MNPTKPAPTPMNGGQILVNALETHGVKRVFCVPGESYLPVLDALHDSEINTTLCRHEGGASMMAEAWGKIAETPGICFVTRGPGATNACSGLHVALQDSTPMILFIGQIGTQIREREAFQEVDYRRFLGSSVKWVAEIDDADRIDEMVSRAFFTATSGRPGPVALALPESTLAALAEPKEMAPWQQIETYPGVAELEQLAQLLATAQKPLMIVGGSRWDEQSVLDLQALAQAWKIPVACSFRRQMLFDHSHPNYAGDVGIGINPNLKQQIDESDVLLLVGGRFSEMPSQDYTLVSIPTPNQTLVHVYPGAEELGRVYRAHLPIHASPRSFIEAFKKIPIPLNNIQRDTLINECHNKYENWSMANMTTPGRVQMGTVMNQLAALLPADSVITNGAGNYASWIHRFWKFKHYGSQLAPTSGSMGYGLPAAIAAKLYEPNRTVVAFAGDGCFQMTLQELGTAIQAQANVIILVIDNGIYGTIRMHQEKNFPGRVSATTLVNPDFADLANSYGAYAATVEDDSDFVPALTAAINAKKPALIHIRVSPEAITPTTTLSQLRCNALKADQ
ncbi:MAG: thiamine pyrophosphate-binding protein [Granulosicoccus sp.]